MKINKIEIQNFKGFENNTFSFNPNMTVLIGDNGTGKTSILDALSFVLGTFLIGIDGISTRYLKQNERRKIVFSPKNFEIKLPFKINVQQTLLGKEYNYFRDAKKEKGISTHINAKPLIEEAKLLTSQVRDGINVNLPLIAYYSTARLTRKNEKIDYEKMASRLIAYDNVLNPELVQYKFLEWLKTQEDEIKKFQRKEEISLYKAFTQTISSMIPEWTDIQFSWRMDDMLGQLNNGEWMSFRMLSDGYQNIIRIAADIAYRAIILNPHLGINAVKETEGVVLIDEIDMHLHPNWQKTVIADFKRTFPNIQFIVTTHSPFIVQSLKADEIINLDGNVNGQPYTKSIEEIAENEMHVNNVIRSQKFIELNKLASDYFDLIEQGKTSKNDDETRKIKEKLDEIELEFNEDPVYIALMRAERKTGLKYATCQ
jgi:predicted ATP-binding protein involved in virulence